jgi:hypothetical protein
MGESRDDGLGQILEPAAVHLVNQRLTRRSPMPRWQRPSSLEIFRSSVEGFVHCGFGGFGVGFSGMNAGSCSFALSSGPVKTVFHTRTVAQKHFSF